jgi:hypothetical protein
MSARCGQSSDSAASLGLRQESEIDVAAAPTPEPKGIAL